MVNPEVIETKLAGEIRLLGSKLDDINRNFTEKFGELNTKLEKQISHFENFVVKEDFDRHLREAEAKIKEIQPLLQWVEDRKAVEKFLYGIIAFIGVSNIILLIKIIFFSQTPVT